MDPNRQIDKEQQRARMLDLLRRCDKAMLITVDEDGRMIASYMNINMAERRGLSHLLTDTAPRFRLGEDDES